MDASALVGNGAQPGRPTRLRRVVVTGATGLLGSNVVGELLDRGVEVVAIVRNDERARRLLGDRDGLHRVVGDVLSADALIPVLCGAEAVVHTAAYFREYYQPGYDLSLLERTNVTAVSDLLAAAHHADVAVFVHISSSGTIGRAPSEQLADEDTAPARTSRRNHYYASKVRADQLIDSLRDQYGVQIPVVVPGWMWGPGDAAPTASGQMFLSVAHGSSAGVPRVSAHIVDVRDVAHACVQAATRAHNRRYVVAGQRQSLPAVCAQIAQLCGVATPRAVGPGVALATSGLLQLSDRLRGKPPLVTPRGTRVLLEANKQHISSLRAQTELGVTFRPIGQTLADEAHWFARHGHIRLRSSNAPPLQRDAIKETP
jgi:dihydroflavonol-4-reductase